MRANGSFAEAMAVNSLEPNIKSLAASQLSVILVTPDQGQALSRTIQSLKKQTIANRLEIVVVAPSADALALNTGEFESFAGWKTVSIGEIRAVGAAYAAGVRAATAPVVALGEDHSFPHSDWAERLVAAHEYPWAAVGPQICNANPDSSVATADYLIAYGPWSESAKSGEVEHLPGHNSSYKRELLLEYGDSLSSMLEAESVLHWQLRRSGHKLYLETAAKTSHVNMSRLASWASAQYHAGRMFAAFRARNEHWGFLRRAAFTVAGPLIPLVRLQRVLRQLNALPVNANLAPLLPALCFGLMLDGLGQMAGYATGEGKASEKAFYFEFHRERHLRKGDQRLGASGHWV
jgi:GT2 family glycosyltransferase